MNKLKRIWRAFCAGFWAAWREVAPKKLGKLEVEIACDTTEFNVQLDQALAKLERFKVLRQETLPIPPYGTPGYELRDKVSKRFMEEQPPPKKKAKRRNLK